MIVTRRRALGAASAGLALPALPLPARGQPARWSPDRAVTFLVGFPAGGVIDYVARLLARELAPLLGQNVVVENRTGASGNLATQALARMPADGHAIGFAAIHLAANPALMPLGYDPARDIEMLTQTGHVPVYFLASLKGGLASVRDVVAAGRARPGELNFASGGIGTSSHLAAELFSRQAGFRFTHVPFRGGAPSMQALLQGEVDCSFTVAEAAIPGNVASGRIRGLAVMQEARIPAAPSVPAIAEAGFGPEVFISSWHGVMMRTGWPPAVKARWFEAVTEAMRTPALTEGLARAGIEPRASASPADFASFVAAETERWTRVIREAGITAQ
ncbi:Bug family tripartite tricarboxylate transporter substrate binding protein [Falsiroseomonas ponticola]|uniref:Bug family tripartite tricarboxylate transporter substrate binding protein n=1 Tax=Falsiroseomonas ponticola TaxID=2786951 RepID=UPI001933B3C8|nr:tripartite tricarboxylate transporter substrate-binding protein [Roseomonas ponticola]